MAKRMMILLIAMGVFTVALGFVKYQQIRAAIAGAASFAPPPEAVTTLLAKEEPWNESLSAIGSLAAVQGVTVSSDLPGIVSRIAFDSGKVVAKGDVLVELDTKQEQAQLRAAEAERELARLSLERVRGLHDKGVTSRAELDSAEAGFKSADARLGEIRATIDRKTIRAPFSGVLGIRQVNLGQYLNSGDPVVPLQSLDPIYVNFSLPQQEIEHLKLGIEVAVRSDGVPPIEVRGRVNAVDSVVDEATRNVRVQATIPNPDRKLHPGMFVETRIEVGQVGSALVIPASSILYAPYGDSVFIVEEMKAPTGGTYLGVRQQFVKLGPARGDQVSVLSGLKAGEQVVTSGAFKLRNGAAVQVNNQVQPSNDPAPKPQES
ncbi:MAG TPA: efflux RND transporter periplasmic adaptor subunit [Candidatus Polarisedimenticolaceae bacterium]